MAASTAAPAVLLLLAGLLARALAGSAAPAERPGEAGQSDQVGEDTTGLLQFRKDGWPFKPPPPPAHPPQPQPSFGKQDPSSVPRPGDENADIPGFDDSVTISFAHAEPVHAGLDAAIAKACKFIKAAGSNGVDLLVFSEAWLPGHLAFHDVVWPQMDHQPELRHQAPCPEKLQPLLKCVGAAHVNVIMPTALEEGKSVYNAALYIDKAGKLLAVHRKHLTSYETHAGQYWWDNGVGTDYAVAYMKDVGRVCTLLGTENYLMMARYTLVAQGCEFWLAPTQDVGEVTDRHIINIAREEKVYVIGVGELLSVATAQKEPRLLKAFTHERPLPAGAKWVRDGGGSIAAPGYLNYLVWPVHANDPASVKKVQDDGNTIAVPGYADEFLVVAPKVNVTRAEVIRSKLYQDLSSNYLTAYIWNVTWHNGPRGPCPTAKATCESDSQRDFVVKAAPKPPPKKPVKMAVAQYEPKDGNLSATIEQACDFILEAGKQGVDIMTFKEVAISGYPWFLYWTHTYDFTPNNEIYYQYVKNSPQVYSGDLKPLYECVKQAGVNVVVPIGERDSLYSQAGIYNAALFIDKSGKVLARHRKNMPSHTERFWWTLGDGTDYVAVDMPDVGRVCTLFCWETFVITARYELMQKGCEFLLAPTGDFGPIWDMHAASMARESNVYVLTQGSLVAPNGPLIAESPAAHIQGTDWYQAFKDDFARDRPGFEFFMDGGGAIIRPDGNYLATATHSQFPSTVQAAQQGCKQSWDAAHPGAEHCQLVEVPGYRVGKEFLLIATGTREEIYKARSRGDHVGNEQCSSVWTVTWPDKPRRMLFEDKHAPQQLYPDGFFEAPASIIGTDIWANKR